MKAADLYFFFFLHRSPMMLWPSDRLKYDVTASEFTANRLKDAA